MSEQDEQYDGPAPEPAKLEAAAAAYGWLVHLGEMVEEAKADLEVYVPEDQRAGATERARSRAGAFHLGLPYGSGDPE